MLLVVDAVNVEHGGQVHVREMAAVERSQAVLGEVLDPLGTRTIVLLRVVRRLNAMVMRVSVVVVRHRRD